MQEINILSAPRSPTHQIQIYNQYGQFVRKFGANILQHPRGVCVDNKGRIIVVECKVYYGWFKNILSPRAKIFSSEVQRNGQKTGVT